MQPQMDGLLTAETERIASLPLDDEAATLRADVHCILLECHRDRHFLALRDQVAPEALEALAGAVATRLAPRIGGRYVPKGQYREGWQIREQRDAAVWQAFNGRNHREVMGQFGISRRLLYSILSRRRRVVQE